MLGVLSHHCVALFVALLSCLVMFLRTRAALCWECCHITVLHHLLRYCHVSSRSSGPGQCYVRVLSCHWYIIVMFCHVPQDPGSVRVLSLVYHCHVLARSSGPGQCYVRVLSCHWYIIVISCHVPQDLGNVETRSKKFEAKLIILRLMSVLLSRTRGTSKSTGEVGHVSLTSVI